MTRLVAAGGNGLRLPTGNSTHHRLSSRAADASVAAGGDATYTLIPLDNEIFFDPSLQPPNADPTAAGGLATNLNSVRNGAYGYNFQYLGNSRTIDDQGDYPNSPYINYPVTLVNDASRTISFGDSRGGNVGHGGHSMTLDPPHERVHPVDAFSTSVSSWGSPSPALMKGFDPYGPDETGTDIQIYYSPAEERHNGRANVVFLDGHTESHTLQELGYVVTPYTYTVTNTVNVTATPTSITANVAWPQHLVQHGRQSDAWHVALRRHVRRHHDVGEHQQPQRQPSLDRHRSRRSSVAVLRSAVI